MSDLAKITIDGQEYEVPVGANLLQVCLDLGLLVPHFCYHEALGPAGACRLCAAMVSPAKDKPARLEMTCMTRVSDGMVVSIRDPYAVDFRRGVIEYLMLNHPHDCPVCDEGGECMLQDMTVLSEHIHRRSRFPKRTWRNQYLGPFIHHEMNRCITCYRCVRFYRDYALGKDFGVFGSRDRVYFGRVRDGVLESEFAGNLVDVCPTGVFTDKRFREVYTRPWDLRTAHTVCVHCSVGCNLLVGGRHSTLRRIKPAPNVAVNRFFICDRGRFGGEFVNATRDRRHARIGDRECPPPEAIRFVAARLSEIAHKYGPDAIVAVGSARATLETNAALRLALKALGGSHIAHFDTDTEHEAVRLAARLLTSRTVPTPTMEAIEKSDMILSVGGDLTAEAPMLDLSVRQAIRAGGKLFVISPRAGKLDEFASAALRIRPDLLADVVLRIADALSHKDATVSPEISDIVRSLASAKRPVILCSVLHEDVPLVAAAFRLASNANMEERPCQLAYYFAGPNSVGVALARDSIKPSKVREAVDQGKAKAIIAVEHNLAEFFGDETRARELLARCEFSVIIDAVSHPCDGAASVTIPALPPYASSGKFVNYEGRVQHSNALALAHPVSMTPSDVLVQLVEELGHSELLQQAAYAEIYAIERREEALIESLEGGMLGVRVTTDEQTVPEPTPPATRTTDLVRWNAYFAFGSEPLSALSPPIAELAPSPHVELNPEDAEVLGVAEGQDVDLSTAAGVRGKVKLNKNLARGTISVPVLYATSGVRGAVQEVSA